MLYNPIVNALKMLGFLYYTLPKYYLWMQYEIQIQ